MSPEDTKEALFVRVSKVHALRIILAAKVIAKAAVCSVVDIGCGEGTLLHYLALTTDIAQLYGFDQSMAKVAASKNIVDRGGLCRNAQIRHGGIADNIERIRDAEALSLVEVIEHLDSAAFESLRSTVFTSRAARIIVVTTPNADYNVALGRNGERPRHSDHRFEWTRAQFRTWVDEMASVGSFAPEIYQIGAPSPALGGITQMAVFER